MSVRTYLKKGLNCYYWWMDKLCKPAFIRRYPRYLRSLGVRIAEDPGDTWISPTVFLDSAGYDMIEIGEDCTISFDVAILVHDYSIETALRASGEPPAEKHRMIMRPVKIGSGCFIGARTMILPGAVIGDGCVIGAGSVVRGKIPPGSIASGNPASVVGSVSDFAERHLAKDDIVFDGR